MFRFHLPQSVYERLPWIYVVAALLIFLSPLGDLKVLPILALILAALQTARLRLIHRSKS